MNGTIQKKKNSLSDFQEWTIQKKKYSLSDFQGLLFVFEVGEDFL